VQNCQEENVQARSEIISHPDIRPRKEGKEEGCHEKKKKQAKGATIRLKYLFAKKPEEGPLGVSGYTLDNESIALKDSSDDEHRDGKTSRRKGARRTQKRRRGIRMTGVMLSTEEGVRPKTDAMVQNPFNEKGLSEVNREKMHRRATVGMKKLRRKRCTEWKRNGKEATASPRSAIAGEGLDRREGSGQPKRTKIIEVTGCLKKPQTPPRLSWPPVLLLP